MFAHFSKKDKNKLKSLITVLIIGIVCFVFTQLETSMHRAGVSDSPAEEEAYNVMHYLDAGQGDCTLLETRNGKFALIDASTQGASEAIIKYLTSLGVEELEYVIFTHPHEDHIGGGDEVLRNFKVNNVYMSDKTENTSAFKKLVSQIGDSKENYGTRVINPSSGDSFQLDGIEFTFLSDGKKYEDLNNSSLCLKVEYGKSTFIFTGDAEKEVERDLISSGIFLDAEVYKCGHHGSSTSNSKEFLDKISPDLCIISCGKDNDYGHPHSEVTSLLSERNIPYYITHEYGNILVGFNKKNIIMPESLAS